MKSGLLYSILLLQIRPYDTPGLNSCNEQTKAKKKVILWMKLHYIAARGVQSNINDYIYMSTKPRSKAQLGIYNTNKWMKSKYDL